MSSLYLNLSAPRLFYSDIITVGYHDQPSIYSDPSSDLFLDISDNVENPATNPLLMRIMGSLYGLQSLNFSSIMCSSSILFYAQLLSYRNLWYRKHYVVNLEITKRKPHTFLKLIMFFDVVIFVGCWQKVG